MSEYSTIMNEQPTLTPSDSVVHVKSTFHSFNAYCQWSRDFEGRIHWKPVNQFLFGKNWHGETKYLADVSDEWCRLIPSSKQEPGEDE